MYRERLTGDGRRTGDYGVRDDVDEHGHADAAAPGGRPTERPTGPALVASLAARDGRYDRVARLRSDLAPVAGARGRTRVVDGLVSHLHLPLLRGPAARAAARWRALRASATQVAWRPWWRAPLVALALLPLALAGAAFVAVLVVLVAADVTLRTLPISVRAVRRSLHPHPLDLGR